MIRRPPTSTRVRSSAASDVYKRQPRSAGCSWRRSSPCRSRLPSTLSLIHISEPTRLLSISYAVFCLKKKNRGTFTAIIDTPARIGEVLAAKASLGVILAFLMSLATLLLNNAVGSNWADLLVDVLLGAVFT